MTKNKLANLPGVDEVLRTEAGRAASDRFGHETVVGFIRKQLAALRRDILAGQGEAPSVEEFCAGLVSGLEAANASSVRPIHNLTGVVLHTNLGRAILPKQAIETAMRAMASPVALEFDLGTGGRGERDDHVKGLLCELTGAEDAIVVNNNAAAVFLVLATLAPAKETLVSRGELIEIGGSFRIPDIMQSAGSILREVGTTNRTHPADYENAIGPQTALLMKVHKSNYSIQGFTAEVSSRNLAMIANKANLPFVDDLGSGTIADLSAYGLSYERTVQDALRDGADLVTFSGDKLLGGPQAGFIVGRKDLVRRCARHPLKRAVRLDKIRLAALEAVLRLYRDPKQLANDLPTLRCLARPKADIVATAEALRSDFARWAGADWQVDVVDCESRTGSGSLPLQGIPSAGLALTAKESSGDALGLMAARLRELPVPIIGRIANNRLILDFRCVESPDALRANLMTS